MERLLRWLNFDPAHVALQDRVLVFIILLVGALFVLAVSFAVAVVILRAFHVRRRRHTTLLAAQWEDRLLDALGGETAPSVFHALVREGDEIEALAYLLKFARRVRGDEARMLATIAVPYIPHARRGLRSRSPEDRAFAVQALAAFGAADEMERVVAALDDPSPYVAMTAAQALGRPEHAEHATLVMQRLWRFADWSGDYLSAMLARIGEPAALPARQILGDTGQPAHARAVAADVLRRLSDMASPEIATAVLAESGPSEQEPALHAAALRLLSHVGHAAHLDAVRPFARSPHGLVRAEAMRAFAALGGASEVETLTDALGDASQWVAQEAARALVRLGRQDVLRRAADANSAASLVARQTLAEVAG